jgi:hypothetical protein
VRFWWGIIRGESCGVVGFFGERVGGELRLWFETVFGAVGLAWDTQAGNVNRRRISGGNVDRTRRRTSPSGRFGVEHAWYGIFVDVAFVRSHFPAISSRRFKAVTNPQPDSGRI